MHPSSFFDRRYFVSSILLFFFDKKQVQKTRISENIAQIFKNPENHFFIAFLTIRLLSHAGAFRAYDPN
jgi:hypothetical protein